MVSHPVLEHRKKLTLRGFSGDEYIFAASSIPASWDPGVDKHHCPVRTICNPTCAKRQHITCQIHFDAELIIVPLQRAAFSIPRWRAARRRACGGSPSALSGPRGKRRPRSWGRSGFGTVAWVSPCQDGCPSSHDVFYGYFPATRLIQYCTDCHSLVKLSICIWNGVNSSISSRFTRSRSLSLLGGGDKVAHHTESKTG